MNNRITNLDGISVERLPEECIVYLVRVHGDNHQYGDPWKSSFVLCVAEDICYVHSGISKEENIIRNKGIKCVVNFLKSIGVKKINYTKVKNGELREYEINIA